MNDQKPIQIDERIFLIDGFDLGVSNRTGTYVIDDDMLTLVETGPSPSIKHIKKGLDMLGLSLDQIKYIIVTHIHLDHAGGAGLMIKECPNASIVVHPKGARHLADPKRLIAGAREVYGDNFEKFFKPIVPVPEERLLVKGEAETLKIGPECTLTFFDTPGHAKHHFSIYDPVSNGIFTGDTVGIRYEQLIRDGVDLFLPSTSPNQFNPVAMRNAIERIHNMGVDRIYYGHFGMTEKVDYALRQASEWLAIFEYEGEEIFNQGKGHQELAERMLQRVKKHLQTLHVDDDHDVYKIIDVDMHVSALGIMDYFHKKR
ncbi:MBL fold metallo-hydrolase [Lentibacillus sp. Marseille-P4043]|uniref:MBL fold metallo-hydrolase n=1 Tax=Lentibacillus sp. Marseille-P4043 TaxID=2040293 RepID=UPI000D0BADD3|nr:MBL fold metallo-hydrolase [Lentibacillus sp. Marseille-P4043]